MASPTPNKGYTYPAHGGAVNAWDTPLNENFDTIDLNLGGHWRATISSTIAGVTYYSSGAAVSSTAASITLPTSLAANINYEFSGTLTQNMQVIMPSEGGFYTFKNGLSGNFTLNVGTTSSAGVVIQPGGTNAVACDADIIYFANSNQGDAQLQSYLGSPNGNVDGVVAGVNGGVTDVLWDVTNRQLYIPTANSSTAWAPQLARLVPEGILTGTNSTSNPIMISDTTATTLYYTPFIGNWTVLSTGTILFPYQFSQMSLPLTASQAANNIYDIFMWWNSGTPVIGTGPSWTAGGGSVTPGSCARGTGAGSTALTRLQGILVNSVQVSILNNVTTYVVPANEGIYLGSIYIDGTAGNVSCYRSWGQSRKWGIWNMYNRKPIKMLAGDNTVSWLYNTNTIRASNGDSDNNLTVFCGFAEDIVDLRFAQNIQCSNSAAFRPAIGIGVNSITVTTGLYASAFTAGGGGQTIAVASEYSMSPFLGINTITSLENGAITGGTFRGTESNMILSASCMV